MAPREAFEEQDTSERSLTRKANLEIEVGSELSFKQEERKEGNFSLIKARFSGERRKYLKGILVSLLATKSYSSEEEKTIKEP
jgi:hypothetical protein